MNFESRLSVILESIEYMTVKAKDLKPGQITKSGAKILNVLILPNKRRGTRMVEVAAFLKGKMFTQYWPAEGNVLCRKS